MEAGGLRFGAQTHAVARLGLVWLGTDRCVGHFVAEGENARRSAAREGGLLMMPPPLSLPSLFIPPPPFTKTLPPPLHPSLSLNFLPFFVLQCSSSSHLLFLLFTFQVFSFFHKHFVVLSFQMFLFIFLLLSFFPPLIPPPPFLSLPSPFILPSLFSLFSSCSSSFLHLPKHFSFIFFHSQNLLSLECFQRDFPSSSHICSFLPLFHPPFPPSPSQDTSFLLFFVLPLFSRDVLVLLFLNFFISLYQKTCCPLCCTFLKMFPSFSPFSSSLILLLYLFFLPDAVLFALLHLFK